MKTFVLSVVVGLAIFSIEAPLSASEVTAEAAFTRLKSLEGTWEGSFAGESEAADSAGPAMHRIQVSAAGSVVMETMGPGTEHEMINMYHLDGDDLLLTHYCAAGNQPQMKLDRAKSTEDVLIFDFIGGTNLDPAIDHHIHAAEVRLVDGDRIESIWQSWGNGQPQAAMTFELARTE